MRFFTLHDVQEITVSAGRAFLETFKYYESDEESDYDFKYDESDSDLSNLDLSVFGCGEITEEVESLVENTWEICKPLDEVYGETASEIIKETVITAKEETQCAGIKLFEAILPSEDRNLIKTCTQVCFWCCCETIKKVSPIISEATNNLMY